LQSGPYTTYVCPATNPADVLVRLLVVLAFAISDTGIAISGTGIAISGAGIAISGTGIAIRGTGIAIRGTGIAAAGADLRLVVPVIQPMSAAHA
jgi:hypothetical protein